MRRPVAYVLLILFVIWILPLGAFIDPSKEDKACGGQRAICLCSHLIAKHGGTHKLMMLVNPGTHKEEGPSGGASHDFLAAVGTSLRDPSFGSIVFEKFPAYQFFASRNIEHVPKA